MIEIIDVLIGGIAVGSLYAVMSIGLSLVYGVSRTFNFAYGSFLIWGAYLSWILMDYFYFNYAAVFIIVIIVMFFWGVVVETVIIGPLRKQSNWQISSMMVTLALALVMDSISMFIFGPYVKRLPPLSTMKIHIGDFIFSTSEIGMVLISIFVVIALEVILNKTRQGMSIKAVAQDVVGAQIVGIPITKMYKWAFGISAAMAGVSGVLLGSKYFISPLMGWAPFSKVFVIVAFGGLGSIRGTLYAAFILGILEAFISWQIGASMIMFIWFIILIGVLAIKPRGLLGDWG